MPERDWKQMHWIDKNGHQPTYYIVHGVFEQYPSRNHPTKSAINYLSSSKASRHDNFGNLYE
eukprot:15349799-Ditylum_brightwellii.AAC.1